MTELFKAKDFFKIYESSTRSERVAGSCRQRCRGLRSRQCFTCTCSHEAVPRSRYPLTCDNSCKALAEQERTSIAARQASAAYNLAKGKAGQAKLKAQVRVE